MDKVQKIKITKRKMLLDVITFLRLSVCNYKTVDHYPTLFLNKPGIFPMPPLGREQTTLGS